MAVRLLKEYLGKQTFRFLFVEENNLIFKENTLSLRDLEEKVDSISSASTTQL